MINIEFVGHSYQYEIDEIISLFFDNREKYNYKIVSTLVVDKCIFVNSEIFSEETIVSKNTLEAEYNSDLSELDLRKISKRLLKMSLFKALKKIISKDIPWGILTGIRPTKIVHEMFQNGFQKEEIFNTLTKDYEIHNDKAQLLLEVSKREKNIIENTIHNSISMYIGIPFCPTRCLYCSFTSNSIEKYNYLIDTYIEALIKEIKSIKDIIKSNNWNVQTIYVGGGTPTSLNAKQLDRLLSDVNRNFDFKNIEEITVEAGRPDTITKDKLQLIKQYGIDRISINPQTMNKETLEKIRRNHTPKDIIDSFNLARKIGFDNINMDIIVGLPGENESHIIKTMTEIQKLSPESLTIHTLAIKRASKLNENMQKFNLAQANTIKNMLKITKEYVNKMNLKPYYMYRQKNILGNFENVGYSKEKYECIYNVQIMEENQTILALGAGGVSKIVDLEQNRIERIFNVKNVEQYIKRIDEMIERKKVLYK